MLWRVQARMESCSFLRRTHLPLRSQTSGNHMYRPEREKRVSEGLGHHQCCKTYFVPAASHEAPDLNLVHDASTDDDAVIVGATCLDALLSVNRCAVVT